MQERQDNKGEQQVEHLRGVSRQWTALLAEEANRRESLFVLTCVRPGYSLLPTVCLFYVVDLTYHISNHILLK